MSQYSEYNLVDFASRHLRGFRNNIASVGELPRLMERYASSDCFSTHFLFNSALAEYVKRNGGSVAGYDGPVRTNYLALDIDSSDLTTALETARRVCGVVLDDWGGSDASVVPYWSGRKGFHVMLDTRLFGVVEPAATLPHVLGEVRRSLARSMKRRQAEVLDLGIGDRLHLLRLPNTRHSSSGLYKVPLTLDELMQCDVEQIRLIARNPRPARLTDPTGLLPASEVEPCERAIRAYEESTYRVDHAREEALPDSRALLTRGSPDHFLCDAEHRLYTEGVPEGARSSMALRFASRMRAAGYEEGEAAEMIASWNRHNRPPLATPEARRIVRVAYSGNRYEYGCGRGTADSGHAKLVYDTCPYPNRLDCKKYALFRSRQTDAKPGT